MTNSLSPCDTGMLTLACPVHVSPSVTTVPSVGTKLIEMISSKRFESGDCDRNTLATIVDGLKLVDTDNATLKKAEKSVITPFLGTTIAKFTSAVSEPVRSMGEYENITLTAELPIPIAAEVPNSPSPNPVIKKGKPEE